MIIRWNRKGLFAGAFAVSFVAPSATTYVHEYQYFQAFKQKATFLTPSTAPTPTVAETYSGGYFDFPDRPPKRPKKEEREVLEIIEEILDEKKTINLDALKIALKSSLIEQQIIYRELYYEWLKYEVEKKKRKKKRQRNTAIILLIENN